MLGTKPLAVVTVPLLGFYVLDRIIKEKYTAKEFIKAGIIAYALTGLFCLVCALFPGIAGTFTGAVDARKGYFEEADGGTIFLDEVAELPLPTQARLLRVLQTGEFIRVGSSKVQKTNVRVVAATNVHLQQAILDGRFREDLFYRLATVPIAVPALRERKRDIPLLFRKFASDVAVQYRMPAIVLDDSARELLMNYYWRGNIRQLKNVAEQISAVENVRTISAEVLATYLPDVGRSHPATTRPMGQSSSDFTNERELLYKLLFDMRAEIGDLKRMVAELMQRTGGQPMETPRDVKALLPSVMPRYEEPVEVGYAETEEVEEEPRERTKADVQREQILRALRRNNGRRKEAAAELFMSERTLYRKIKELGIEE